MTDQEDRAPLDDPTLQDLNTIKVTIAWINGCKKVYYDEDSKPKETAQSGTENSIEADPPARWVNEQMAQKGHAGSAELGPLIPNPPQADSPTKIKKKKKKQDWHYKYQKVDSPPPLSFVFHYAPKEWLQDRGIIRQPAATPVVDLSATQPQPQPTQDENAHPSPAPHEELEQERAAPTTSTARNDSPRPKVGYLLSCQYAAIHPNLLSRSTQTEPLAPTDHGELLRLPLREACLTGGAVSPGQGYAMNRDEKARLSPLTAPSINPSETQQSTGSRILSVKRERELSPPNFEVISSDDEIEILDIKPSKPITSKRPRMKYEDKDSKPTRETLESEPYVCHHEEIDPWRLGC
ncbi:hypothetical protein FRC07_001067 [Ceratobasidium sp. 392]|nr:hypothetical protein FRC07_001067 [Ceratobasidium sp. 392]